MSRRSAWGSTGQCRNKRSRHFCRMTVRCSGRLVALSRSISGDGPVSKGDASVERERSAISCSLAGERPRSRDWGYPGALSSVGGWSVFARAHDFTALGGAQGPPHPDVDRVLDEAYCAVAHGHSLRLLSDGGWERAHVESKAVRPGLAHVGAQLGLRIVLFREEFHHRSRRSIGLALGGRCLGSGAFHAPLSNGIDPASLPANLTDILNVDCE